MMIKALFLAIVMAHSVFFVSQAVAETYVVEPDDTLSGIASKLESTTTANLRQINGLQGNFIKEGQVLTYVGAEDIRIAKEWCSCPVLADDPLEEKSYRVECEFLKAGEIVYSQNERKGIFYALVLDLAGDWRRTEVLITYQDYAAQ